MYLKKSRKEINCVRQQLYFHTANIKKSSLIFWRLLIFISEKSVGVPLNSVLHSYHFTEVDKFFGHWCLIEDSLLLESWVIKKKRLPWTVNRAIKITRSILCLPSLIHAFDDAVCHTSVSHQRRKSSGNAFRRNNELQRGPEQQN